MHRTARPTQHHDCLIRTCPRAGTGSTVSDLNLKWDCKTKGRRHRDRDMMTVTPSFSSFTDPSTSWRLPVEVSCAHCSLPVSRWRLAPGPGTRRRRELRAMGRSVTVLPQCMMTNGNVDGGRLQCVARVQKSYSVEGATVVLRNTVAPGPGFKLVRSFSPCL
jgi:hypothetical protein